VKTLLVGYKAADLFERGKHGKKFTAKWLDENVLCHTLDIYHRHAIEKTHHIRAICSPHLPEGPWDLIKFKTGPKLMSGELSLDMLQEIHRLKPAKFELEFVGKERDKNDLLAKIRDNPERVRDFSAKWPASVPGGEKLMFTSYPGCFCHRRLDEGGLALAEVISRDLTSSPSSHFPLPISLLDMGCGCGLVGFLIKSVVKDLSLVMVDSHSRAVEAANVNAANFNMTSEIILADNGTPARMDGTFDVFAGNPPYYSDYRIAEVFLETAKRALKPGGVCYTVVKNDAGLRPVQERYFPNVEVIRRRGYCVLKSQKPM
jgi:16S rRNA (guanine1207-N2)-methyltransferase